MFKFVACVGATSLTILGTGASGSILGPDAARCGANDGPAILVHVAGLKDRQGQVRTRIFGGAPSTWFDKRNALKRTEVPIPANGAVDICMPVERPGVYAVDIRHDTNGNGKTEIADGGGLSGNPDVSLFDIVLKRRPPADKVSVRVGDGITPVTIIVKYKQGGSFKAIAPLQSTQR